MQPRPCTPRQLQWTRTRNGSSSLRAAYKPTLILSTCTTVFTLQVCHGPVDLVISLVLSVYLTYSALSPFPFLSLSISISLSLQIIVSFSVSNFFPHSEGDLGRAAKLSRGPVEGSNIKALHPLYKYRYNGHWKWTQEAQERFLLLFQRFGKCLTQVCYQYNSNHRNICPRLLGLRKCLTQVCYQYNRGSGL